MHPIFLKLGPLTIHTYGLMLALGAALALWLLGRLAKKSGLDQEKVLNLAMWVLISGIAGSRLAFVLLEPRHFLARPWHIFFIWDGGLVFYGGLAGGLLAGVLLIRHGKLALWPVLDCFAPALALGQAFGRLGCFAAGCCYGLPDDGWCAVVFSDPNTLAPKGVPIYPTQLFHAAELFALTGFLLWLWPRRRFAGQIFCAYGLAHGVARVVIEQFRGDWRGAPVFWGLAPTAVVALLLALLSACGLLYLAAKNKKGKGAHGVSR